MKTKLMQPARLWVGALAAAMLLTACGRKEEAGTSASEKPAAEKTQTTNGHINVHVATAEARELAQPVHAAGLLGTKEELRLSFKIGGIVEKTYIDQGQYAQAGQLLATLNQREIANQESQAQQGLEKAERDLKRAEALHKDSVATLEQLQNARTAMEVAKSSLAIAQFNKQYAAIHAPVAGRIVRKLANEGELVSAGAPVYVLSTPGKGWVLRTGIADRDAVRIRIGDAARITFSAFPNETFTAYVSEIAAAATAGTGTYEVELLVNTGTRNVATGLVGKAEILPSAKLGYLLLPVEALIEADGSAGAVYVLNADNETVNRRQVKIAFVEGNRVAVSSGVARGDRVVTDGAAYLNESSKVKLVQ